MPATKISLPEDSRNKVIDMLHPILADAQDLYFQIKQAHWNVRGKNFIALHELFDQIATEVNTGVDTVAERIMQLGGTTEGTIREAAKKSRLDEYPAQVLDEARHVEAVVNAIAKFTSYTREAIDAADEAGDAITTDMLTVITSGLDKQLWFVEAHIN